jgi:hypothetical protein
MVRLSASRFSRRNALQEIFHGAKRPYQPADNFLPDAMIFQPVFHV